MSLMSVPNSPFVGNGMTSTPFTAGVARFSSNSSASKRLARVLFEPSRKGSIEDGVNVCAIRFSGDLSCVAVPSFPTIIPAAAKLLERDDVVGKDDVEDDHVEYDDVVDKDDVVDTDAGVEGDDDDDAA